MLCFYKRSADTVSVSLVMIAPTTSNRSLFLSSARHLLQINLGIGTTLFSHTSPLLISFLFSRNYTTTPQPGLNGRSIDYPRGKVLGGSTCVNDQVWTRGSKDDFDRYAKVTGDDGWSWDALQPFILGVSTSPPHSIASHPSTCQG